ncbi:MAG: zinc ribbon domain-containing protein [Candidatus Omnitrophica bacterium]|nr:zinc ribbon domain-containing protein [Candidatus Omnitrophota bacterium]
MPTYEYECNACGHAFEALQSMAEPKLTDCPQCGKKKLSRLIGSGSGVIFKGSGFYETDYKKKSAPKSDKPASPCAKADSCPMKASGQCGS